MRKAIFAAMATLMLGACTGSEPATGASLGRFEVIGVEDDDMLKMRAGPGTGYIVIVGLPNGTVLWVQSCQQTGGTRWCKVYLDRARGLKGYVSWAYLREM
ncbi:SH3 domain-containing protein [Puniceibacterium sediminis]|uniref:SH3 domain-containing protein n=1 Tax=Puniceibacterium sediminis TaxID=1608407 RepID=A0A238V0R7_9RHOB|nr:SH3 domain-containing protein [Puniceibacterium sediminis]SNR27607.1 SH3 domain-containing protein [Puniceibacterium sediminis]